LSPLSARVAGRWPQPASTELIAIFLATLAVYLLVAVRLLPFVEPPTGDQPHYLMQTISLVEDGDLDLRNNYTTGASFSQFSAPGRRRAGFQGIPVSYELAPTGHIAVRTTEAGEAWYPKHNPGLPVLLIYGWVVGQALTPWLGGLTAHGSGAWPGVVAEMAAIGALLGVQVWLLAWETSGRRGIAYAIWAAVCFSLPQALTSLSIFPETPAALAIIYAFRHLVMRPPPSRPWQLVAVGLALAVLPWLNPRFVLVAGCLAVLAMAVVWKQAFPRRLRSAALLIGPLIFSALAYRWYQLATFGSAAAVADQYEGFFVPTSVDGALSADWLALLVAALGLLVDRQYGLLIFAPVYALAAVGLVALWRPPGGRWLVCGLGIVAVPYVALSADFRVWWGGWSMPARYLSVLTPLLAAPLAASLAVLDRSRLYRVLFAVLAGAGILVLLLMLRVLGDPNVEQAIFGNPMRNPPLLRWLALRLGLDLAPLLPAIAPWFGDRRVPIPWPQIIGWLTVLGVLNGLSLRALRAARQSRQPATPDGSAVARSSALVSRPVAPDRA
jgi:hypothetical protein